MKSLKYPVLRNNKYYRYILFVTCLSVFRSYYLQFTNVLSSIYLCNHCKYTNVDIISFLKGLCLFVSSIFIYLCASNQQKISSKVLKMKFEQGIFRRRASKNMKITLTDTSRGTFFRPSANNTPLSPKYRVGIKRKEVPEEKPN